MKFISYDTKDTSDFGLLFIENESRGRGAGGVITVTTSGGKKYAIPKPEITLPKYVYSNSEFPQIDEDKYPVVMEYWQKRSNTGIIF